MKKDGRMRELVKRAEKGELSVTVRDCREKKNRIRGERDFGEQKKGIAVIAKWRLQNGRVRECAGNEGKEFVN